MLRIKCNSASLLNAKDEVDTLLELELASALSAIVSFEETALDADEEGYGEATERRKGANTLARDQRSAREGAQETRRSPSRPQPYSPNCNCVDQPGVPH